MNKPIRQKSREEKEESVWKLYEGEKIIDSFRTKGAGEREKTKLERNGLRKLELKRDSSLNQII